MKLFTLATMTLLAAATAAQAGGHSYSYENCLATCGSSHGHSWINGCCDREPSCCDHLWDGYGCYDCCHQMHLPLPSLPKLSWRCLHSKAGPYRVPCMHLPKLHVHRHLPAPCWIDDCVETECADECSACEVPPPPCHRPFQAWHDRIRSMFHCGCGASGGCGEACCGDAMLMLDGEGDIHGGLPENTIPPAEIEIDTPSIDLPPAPTDSEMDEGNKRNKKKRNKEKEDRKTASWLFPALGL